MKVRFTDQEKVVVVALLTNLAEKRLSPQRFLYGREVRRRLSLICNKFLTNASVVQVKKADLRILAKLIDVALEQAKRATVTEDRIGDVKTVRATIKGVIGELTEEPHEAA